MIQRLVRFLIVLLLTPAMWVLVEESGLFLTENLPRAFSNWAVYGFVVYILFYPFFLGNVMRFAETLEHELSHAVFAFLCFKDVRKLEVDLSAGYGEVVVGEETGSNILIVLAPYCLPLVTLVPLLIKWLAFPYSHGPLDLAIGLTLGFHLAGLVRELSHRQPDVWRTGVVTATWIILFVNVLLLVVALAVVLSDYAALKGYFALSGVRIPKIYDDIVWALGQGLLWTRGLDQAW